MALVRQSRPEKLRLDEAIRQFEASLDPPYTAKFMALKTGPAPKPSDVFRLTEEVNRDGHKIHRTWRQYGSRLQKALDQVIFFTKVGDILVGGSQNMIACGVWAAVRLSIQIATGYLTFFDKVSNLWMQIGRSCEVQEELVQLFPQSTELQTLMSEYLVVTVNFCHRIVAFAKRPLISQITSTFSITFDKEFREFESQLGHLAKLMNQRSKVLTTQATLESAKTLSTTSKLLAIGSLTARKRDYEKRRAKLLKKLCPFQDVLDRRQRHERKRGPVHWIFEHDTYKDWKSAAKRHPCVLSGKIGSGKTVAAANIISSLQAYEDPKSTAVAGFFCRGDDPKTLEADTIIGSLVHQLVRSLGPTAERAINRYTPEKSTPSKVIDATLKALPKDRHYFIVIDALDECDTGTMMEVASKLADAQINPTAESLVFSCLYSCRVDSPVLPLLRSLFNPIKARSITDVDIPIHHISMSDPRRDHEIEAFIASEIAARRHIRNLSPDLEAAVTAAVIAGAQGMFLWVALQLEIIFPRYHSSRTLTDSDLTMLLERLPKDLEAAYDKALEHISDPQRSKQVFQLVVGCERPLTTGELAVAANVKPGDIHWDHSTFPLDPSALVWACGGGLLEVMEEDDSVHYIHHSALRHLLLDGISYMYPASPRGAQGSTHLEHKFRFEDASTVVAAICVTYLSYSMHDSRLAKRINVAGDRDILEAVSGSIARNQAATMSGSVTNRLIARVLDRRKPPGSQSSGTTTGIFNLVNSLARQEHQDDSETAMKQFLEYASRYWLDHTKRFMDPSDIESYLSSGVNLSSEAVVPSHCYRLFCSLVRSDLAHIRRPWLEDSDKARAEWALQFGHAAIYNLILCIGFGHGKHTQLAYNHLNHAGSLVNGIIGLIRGRPASITLKGKDLGGILALAIRFTLVKRWSDLEVDTSLISDLAKFGVDLDAPMAAPDGSLWSPLCLFIRDLEWWMNGFEISSNGYVVEHKSHQMAENWSKIQTSHIESLVSYGANPIGARVNTMGGPRPIFMALDLHLWDIALMMLAKTSPADLDFEDECGRTLLGLGILHGDDRIERGEVFCRRLLEAGGNPNIMTCDRAHPGTCYVPGNNRIEELRSVYREGHSAIVHDETMLDIKVPPLVLAARLALYRIFQLLMIHKADIYKTTADGQTIVQVLHEVIQEGVEDVNFKETSSRSKRYLWDYWQILSREGFVPRV